MGYTKRKDGRYQVNVSVGGGKRKTLTATTVKELKAKELELRSLIKRGYDVQHQADTFATWKHRVEENKVKELQGKVYKDFVHKTDYFLDGLGEMRLIDIRQYHIQPLVDSLAIENRTTHKPTSKKTLQMYLTYLSQVFDYAVECRAIEFNPCRYVKIPKTAPKNERRSLSLEEQRMVLESTELPGALPAYIALLAGLRRGEISALLWSDIDLDQKTISVTKSLDMYSDIVKEPKTKSGTRLVSIPDALADFLAAQEHKSVYVVTNTHGGRLSNKAWQCLWNSYLMALDKKYAGPTIGAVQAVKAKDFNKFTDLRFIKPFGLHDLRHTCATNLYFAGVPAVVCKDQMGHADILTTLRIYTHCEQGEKKNSIAGVNEYLKQKDITKRA